MRPTIFLLLFTSACLAAQSAPTDDLFEIAENCKAGNNNDLPALVKCLTGSLTDEEEKARALAYWITNNIAYDVKMLQGGSVVPNKNILRNKRGVCSDYSKLYRSMCDLAGLECYLIDGYNKSRNYRPGRLPDKPNHAWNVVFIDGEPRLMDLTWASGVVDATKGKLKYTPHFQEEMVLADPAIFAERHLPADPRWQLTNTPVSLERFFANEDYAAMTEGLRPSQSYTDSLEAFRQLDGYGQKAAFWQSAHYFHPTHENLRIRVETLLNNTTHLSKGKRVKKNLDRANEYCQQAYRLAEQNTAWGKRKFYMSTAKQGLKYIEYRLDNPNAQ